MPVDKLDTPVENEKKRGKRKATNATQGEGDAPKAQYRKLAPSRPFPTVPTSVSATGPRSAHIEGKNYICITRKTPLGAYLRRCKDAVIKAGHKTLHLHAMGAAIPHLLQLSLSLPEILPYAADEIRTEVLTGTVDVQDEVIPEDEDEDISLRTRGKSTLSIVLTIGDGKDEGAHTGKGRRKRDASGASHHRAKEKGRAPSAGPKNRGHQSKQAVAEKLIYRAEDMEM
ncbi:hypothetical protein PHLGIDRAFT_65984 [Phlebiopsis gigantea 11061_1 CR5-6]|uniref:Uncharacterized protein n=1 Tax=Phlebiopsis gigantea (strain 11061_1 CR5-6) TaxID=745531 RepID=A0A0C3SBT9_PHLG1|nr:hypothetical protein PHLGIDRAFT_65984 [Phlebiopsis gigantea 11061_1 CR5-6]